MLRICVTALMAAATLMVGGPAAADNLVNARTVVAHNTQETVDFDDDICGPRANTTTFFRKIEQVRFAERADGSFSYRDVAVVTYVSDYVDPALPTLTGRLTEVNHFILTPGETFVGTVTFHDFLGDIRIFFRAHVTVVDGEVKVDRTVNKVTGCP